MTDKTDLTQFKGHTDELTRNPFNPSYGEIGQNIQTGIEYNPVGFRAVGKAYLTMAGDDDNHAEQNANANLWAAAPALLSELKAEREENTALRAEVERLREALKQIVDDDSAFQRTSTEDMDGDSIFQLENQITHIVGLARQALNTKAKGE